MILSLLTFLFPGENHQFKLPKKEIFGPADLDKWQKSEAYQVCIF